MEIPTSFWSHTIEDSLKAMQSSNDGLSSIEASRRLKQFGPNTLQTEKQRSLFLEVLKKLLNPLILILVFSSAVSALLGEITEFIIVLAILIVSVLIDTLQEHHASNAAAKLRAHVQITVSVLRDGKEGHVPMTHLVPGDVITLSTGNIVPADCRLLTSESLLVAQSQLTGESIPVHKDASVLLTPETPLAERKNSLFMGTAITSGSATALVIATGATTMFGELAKEITKERPETEFQRGTREFSVLISKFTFVLIIIVFLVNALVKHTILDAFLFSLAIAIGMTPELLPVIISINLAKGAGRMAKKSVIVKDLPAIELFGSMDILCTDKTGTLTQDEIRLEQYLNPQGKQDDEVLRLALVHSTFQTGIHNPMETAILAHEEHKQKGFTKIAEIPFDFDRRCASVVVSKGHHTMMITKGSPEELITASRLSTLEKKHLTKRVEELNRQGFRVLALTTKSVEKKQHYDASDEHQLTFVGLLAFLDPPKNGAKEALEQLNSSGIRLVILTGDSKEVSAKVCEDLGCTVLGIETGSSIEPMSEKELQTVVEHTTIFARLNPEQKERVILALKTNDHVVGYLGDGMNDAPSLRAADVGISVNNAVDVAKETADIILLHKSLRVLHDGVVEGRKTYMNIMKYILMGTSANLGNMFSVAGASLLLPFLPMLPVQVLLNDMLYDFSELAIPTDTVDEEMIQSPRKWDVGFIRRFMLVFGTISSLFDFITFGVLILLKASPALFATVWFMESLGSQTLVIFAIRTHRSPFWKSIPSPLLITTSIGVVVLGLLLPLTVLRHLFLFAFPRVQWYGIIALIVGGYMLVTEIVKRRFYTQVFNTTAGESHRSV